MQKLTRKVNTPIRPMSIVVMMTSFPKVVSWGVKSMLSPTVLRADTTSKSNVNNDAPFSEQDNMLVATATQAK